MQCRKFTYVSLVFTLILLVTTIGTTQAGASSRSEKFPDRDVNAPAKVAASGGPFFIGDFENANAQVPSVAYNSQHKEYLVVWFNDRYGCDDVYGRRITADGVPLGPRFPIANECPGEQQDPDVVYNSLHDEYLVVWYYAAGDTVPPFCIRGRRLSASGDLLGGVIDITNCASTSMYAINPAVGYASTSDMYEVVWSGGASLAASGSVQGQAVSSAGALVGAKTTIAQGDSDWSYEGPDLVYNHRQNGYLVVYQRRGLVAPIGYAIYAHLVHGGGTPTGSSIEIMRISTYQMSPAVAAMPSAYSIGQYLVVWEDTYTATDRDISGRLINGDGSYFTDSFYITTGPDDQLCPDVAANDSNQQYLVTWTDFSSTLVNNAWIQGRAVAINGDFLGGEQFVAGMYANHSAPVRGPLGDFLVTFDENLFPVNKVVMGVFLGNRIYLPLVVK